MKKILTNLTIAFLCCFCLMQSELKAQQALVCNEVVYLSYSPISCEIDIASIDIEDTFLETQPGAVYDNLKLEIYRGSQLIEGTIDASLVNFPLDYVVTDLDNLNSCWGLLKVQDTFAPVAICESDFSVALGVDGTATIFAETFDAGSYDNCSITNMQVRRIESASCSVNNDDTEFSDQVTFYCCDAGTTVLVELGITDPSSNFTSCITEVTVTGNSTTNEFFPPGDSVITCADNYLDLSFPLNDVLGTPVLRVTEDLTPFEIYGAEDETEFLGYYGNSSACGANVIYVYDDTSFLTDCGIGSVARIFTEVQATSTVVTEQAIFIQPSDQDVIIEWPLDTSVCNTASVVNEEPTIIANNCYELAVTYEDVIFTDGNGNPTNIERTWTVIDWCTFEEGTNEGVWTNTQNIIIDTSLCGDCVLACNDFINFSFGLDCQVTITDADISNIFLEDAANLCPNANLELRLFEDATDYANGLFFTNNVLTKDHIGKTLFYEVSDLNSGNICWGSLEVEDKIAPVPVCLTGLSIELPNGTEAVEVWAEDLNIGSYDNCDANAIYFQIRRTTDQNCNGDISDVYAESMMIYCCDVDTPIEVEMLVIDEAGNSDYCLTYITVEGSDDCSCDDACVWPGDTNSDGVANQFDLLNIGLAYGTAGTERFNANSNWIGQNAADWNESFIDNLNFKHADADGNGTVDLLDLFPLAAHWGSEHNFKDTEDQFADNSIKNGVQLYVQVDTFTTGSQVQLPVILDNSDTEDVEVYGVAFSINYDQEKVTANTANIMVDDSWLGTENEDMITIFKDFWSEGRIDVALSRTDGQNVIGQGKICALDIIIEDVIFASLGEQDSAQGAELVDIEFTIDNIRLINQLGEEIPVGATTTTSKVRDLNTSITPVSETTFEVYPNPVADYVKIDLDQLANADIDIIDMNGQVVVSVQAYNSNTKINVADLYSGVYIIQIKDDAATYISKFIKK